MKARQAGIAGCGSMVENPDRAHIYASLARADTVATGAVREDVRALRARDPWLFVVALTDARALPEPGDPAAGQPDSAYSVGIWKDTDGALRVTASDGSEGGTLAASGASMSWTTFTVEVTASGRLRRVEPCAR